MGVSLTTVEELRGAKHDAAHLRDEGLIGLPDCQILAKAVAESRVVLTFDLDFGDILAVARSEAPSVIIFRLRNQTPAAVNPRLFRVIAECAAEFASVAIIMVDDLGFRVRPATAHPALNLKRKATDPPLRDTTSRSGRGLARCSDGPASSCCSPFPLGVPH
jgi:predicted nuclease of predicted toxin-antitoxin system